jgi:alginate O-acetyltransferase complex protein AlgI
VSFAEPLFFFFIAPVLIGIVAARGRFRILLLTLASYVFYAASYPPYVLILLIGTAFDYWVGNKISAETRRPQRFVWLVLTLVSNLGVLIGFKYVGFFAGIVNDLAREFGSGPILSEVSVRLPLGISFFTFQSLSYTIDIYRGVIRPARTLLEFAAFISFFPHLVAGPIIRARDFLPQLDCMQPLGHENTIRGLGLILVGYFKKCVIADNCATFVDPCFANPSAYGGGTLWLASLFFAVQIYADFSGYSDVATGLSRVLGIRLKENFHWPYLARSIRDFWRRWHMSLSFFLRDYLYFSLGGDREGRLKTARNMLVVWFLGGLWHGAAWHFVVWGLWHGALVTAGRQLHGTRLGPIWDRLPAVLQIAWTFAFVTMGWVLFRAPSLSSAGNMLASMTSPWQEQWWRGAGSFLWNPLALVAVAAILHAVSYQRYDSDPTDTVLLRMPYWIRIIAIVLAMVFIVVFAGEARRFIYFDF